jgi:hypothetical protein
VRWVLTCLSWGAIIKWFTHSREAFFLPRIDEEPP